REDRVQLHELAHQQPPIHGCHGLFLPQLQHPAAAPRRESRHQLSMGLGSGRRPILTAPARRYFVVCTATDASTCVSALGLSGLVRWPPPPAARPVASSAALARPDTPTIGTRPPRPGSARMRRVASTPSKSGSVTSINTTS